MVEEAMRLGGPKEGHWVNIAIVKLLEEGRRSGEGDGGSILVGDVAIHLFRGEEGSLEAELGFTVAPDHQGKGVATRAAAAALAELKRLGVRVVRACVQQQTSNAQHRAVPSTRPPPSKRARVVGRLLTRCGRPMANLIVD